MTSIILYEPSDQAEELFQLKQSQQKNHKYFIEKADSNNTIELDLEEAQTLIEIRN